MASKFSYLFIIVFLFSGCASYQSKVKDARNNLKSGQYEPALEDLKKLSAEEGKDQLVYLLDYATALQIAGRYKESNAVFFQADKLVDLNDYHSISNIAASALTSEGMIQYKGESYEKFLINAMLAINYLMLGEYDEAMVESRRINEKLSKFKMDGRKPYEMSPFAHYLAAMLWEGDQKWDDAYISYQQSYKLDATNPLLPRDLIRTAKLARRDDSYNEWKKEFPSVKEDKSWYDKSLGEVIVIYQQGWGPRKQDVMAHPILPSIPSLSSVYSDTQYADIKVNNIEEKTSSVYSIDKVAKKTLEDDIGALLLRRTGAYAAKEVMADQIRQKNQLLGTIAWLGMHLSDRADLRQWSTLPNTIQIAKIQLPPGTYKLHIQGMAGSGTATDESFDKEVKVTAGRKTFINWRSLK